MAPGTGLKVNGRSLGSDGQARESLSEDLQEFLGGEVLLYQLDDLTKVNPVTLETGMGLPFLKSTISQDVGGAMRVVRAASPGRNREFTKGISASVLRCLQARYMADTFYTNAGCTLVALNPFKPVPQLYSPELMREYHAAPQPQPCGHSESTGATACQIGAGRVLKHKKLTTGQKEDEKARAVCEESEAPQQAENLQSFFIQVEADTVASFLGGSIPTLLLAASPAQSSLAQPLLEKQAFLHMTFHSLLFQKLKPHVFTVGEQTYRNVKSLIEPVNQSIVVSGESGAGKVGGRLSHPVNS
ncbi:hypothetical protein P7K49_011109 [Saguinus oedipus]|uniref:Myosin motor domain-containing protein n=1 Tax=Saguinus oedipus TaxID=9490 RepID=A0ABQ9VPR3_SAGOE|nr:hypothetical protein P7K49_011109 [Saguinus oedipus]